MEPQVTSRRHPTTEMLFGVENYEKREARRTGHEGIRECHQRGGNCPSNEDGGTAREVSVSRVQGLGGGHGPFSGGGSRFSKRQSGGHAVSLHGPVLKGDSVPRHGQ